MGDMTNVIHLPISPVHRDLMKVNEGLSQGKTAKQIRDEDTAEAASRQSLWLLRKAVGLFAAKAGVEVTIIELRKLADEYGGRL